jgi:hypothetical protein
LTPTHAVQVFEQGKTPFLLKGFTKLSFLKKDFDSLTKRLEYFLKSSQTIQKNKKSMLSQLKTAIRSRSPCRKEDVSKKYLQIHHPNNKDCS